MSVLLTRIKSRLATWLFAQSACDLCYQPCQQLSLLCDTCHASLPAFKLQFCDGNLLHAPAIARHLSFSHVDNLIAVAPHSQPMSRWIIELKYQRRFELVAMLANVLHQQMQSADFDADALIPVPLATWRLRWRQFNQATLLANALASLTAINCYPHYVQRRTTSGSQVGKGGSARRRALAKAFYIAANNPLNSALKGKHVAIVDDVVTTGSTANMVARVLKRQGVAKVSVLCLSVALVGHHGVEGFTKK